MIRPSEDVALYRAAMAWGEPWPGEPAWRQANRDWVRANDACRRDILGRLATAGPLRSRDLPDTCTVPWKSTGWTNYRNVSQLLEFMVVRGAVAGRSGGDRLWDLASRVYPDDPVVPADEALRIRNERRLRALGIARARGPECPVEPVDVGEVGGPAVVEGVKGTWQVDPSQLGQPFTGRAALLSPFDRLIHDRKRTTELFQIEPDLVYFRRDLTGREVPAAVADAKYAVERISRGENVHVYQMISYCAAYGLPRGHLVYAQGEAEPREHRVLGPSGITIVQHALDLGLPPTELRAQVEAIALDMLSGSSGPGDHTTP